MPVTLTPTSTSNRWAAPAAMAAATSAETAPCMRSTSSGTEIFPADQSTHAGFSATGEILFVQKNIVLPNAQNWAELERAPVARSLAMAGIGLIAAVTLGLCSPCSAGGSIALALAASFLFA